MMLRKTRAIVSVVLALLVTVGAGAVPAMAQQAAHKASKKVVKPEAAVNSGHKTAKTLEKKSAKQQLRTATRLQTAKAAQFQGEQARKFKAQAQRIAELETQLQRSVVQNNELRQQLQQAEAKNQKLAGQVTLQRNKAVTNIFITIACILLLIGCPLLFGRMAKGWIAASISRVYKVKPPHTAKASSDPFDAVTEPSFDDKLFLADIEPDDGLPSQVGKHIW